MDAAVKAYQNVSQRELRDRLVVENLDFVRHVLGKLTGQLPQSIDNENLESAGVLGLVEAASHFDPSRGVEFRSFAYHRIRGAILDELRRNCPLPQKTLQTWSSIRETVRRLGEAATIENIAAECGLTEDQISECLAAVRLTQPESWREELSSQCRRPEDESHSRFHQEDEQQLLAEAIEYLPDRLRLVLSLYYLEDLRLLEIGEVLGLSESRVSRLLAQAQFQLKSLIHQQRLKSA